MSRRRRAAGFLAAAAVAAVTLPASAAPEAPIVIAFAKDCPGFTCKQTAASPVDVTTVITPLAFTDGVLHYAATETLSSSESGSVTLSLTGILNFNTDPDFTVLRGTVSGGSWNGVSLAGAQVWGSATRVGETTVFAGSVTILPASADA
jgi:hypothetical protein